MRQLMAALNGPWHKRGLQVFLFIVVAHWAEHLLQAWQVYGMHWHLSEARGLLGYYFPWLVTSEWLHFAYAVVMVIGFAALKDGFQGRSRTWWNIALGVQTWHLVEHTLLFLQAMTGIHLFGLPQPTSLLQLVIPRVELHLFYNTIVTIPMLAGMYHHAYPSPQDHARMTCSCRRVCES